MAWHSWSGDAFNSATYHRLHLVSMTRQGPRNQQQSYQAISASTQLPFPSFPSPGLESVSSMKEVLFVMAGKAWHRVSWILISRPLKPLCVHPHSVEVGVKAALMGLLLKTEGKKKTKPNHPSSSFLKQKEKLRTAWPQESAPVRRWWPGTTVAESGCQHWLNASSWVFSGPCTCPHRDER